MSDSCTSSLYTDGVRVIEVQESTVGPGRALITVAGEVDHLTCALLQSALARAWEARPVAVAVDLRQVGFLNAGGLRALLLASGTARHRGVPLVLQAGPGQVTRLLTVVGLGEQVLSPAEVGDVLAAATSARPLLRLVPPLAVEDGPVPSAGTAPAVGRTGPGPRSVRRGVRGPLTGGRAGARDGAGSVTTTTEVVVERSGRSLLGIEEARAFAATVAGRAAPGPAASRVLRRALRSRDIVGRATGMLMQRDGITADRALDVLTAASRTRNRSVVEVAEELTGTRPQ